MSNIDATIRGLFDKLAARKTKLEELKKEIGKSWKTNGAFRFIGATATTNIQTAPADVVAQAAVQLSLNDAARKTAEDRLGREIDPKWGGYSLDDWFADFKKRLATIDVREAESQVEQLEQRLNGVLSPEERRRIEVELLAKEIG